MDDADKAYTAAEDEIDSRIRTKRATNLNFNAAPFRALDHLPPAIATFTQLQTLDLRKTQVTDLAPLRGLSALQELYLGNTPVTELTPLQGLSTLQVLNLDNTPVTDLAPLQELAALQTLLLEHAQVTDLTPLHGLSELETLVLDNTQVADLTPLRGLTSLQMLHLNNTQVADLGSLRDLSALQRLRLDNTQVSDLVPLRRLSALQMLNISNTQVTDLRPIADLPSLAILWFKDTPAAAATPELTRLSHIRDYTECTRKTLAYLRTLPPWPEPLPWEETQATLSSRPETATVAAAGQTSEGTTPATHGLPRLITARRARQVLETHATDLRGQCQFVTDQINQTLAQHIPAKPNDPEELAEWTHLLNTLQLSRAAIVSLHEAIPDRAEERPVTDDDANRLKHAFETAIATLQQASAYIDGPAEAHGRTYAGLLKIGVCTALAAPIALISAQPMAVIGGGLYAMLYGKGAALDVVKAIGGTRGPKPDDTP